MMHAEELRRTSEELKEDTCKLLEESAALVRISREIRTAAAVRRASVSTS
jgi:hypothetical protein